MDLGLEIHRNSIRQKWRVVMNKSIDYYYSHISPWSFLGHEEFLEIAKRHDATVNFKPMALPALFAETGGLPLGQRHAARQEYRIVELKRWALKRNIELTIRPAYFPADPTICDLVGVALAKDGDIAGKFALRVFRACWLMEQNVSSPDVVATIVKELGLDPRNVEKWMNSDEIKTRYDKNLEEAINVGAIGAPCYVLNGEPYWGQDRLDLLEDALASGRDPFDSN